MMDSQSDNPTPGESSKQSFSPMVGVFAAVVILVCVGVLYKAMQVDWDDSDIPGITDNTDFFQAPPHNKPIIERDGKTLLWANDGIGGADNEWFDMTDALVDPAEFQYGIGKDSIPSIDDPMFVDIDDPVLISIGYGDFTRVFGYSYGGETKAYAVELLDRHELVNDTFGGKPILVGW